MNPEVLKEISTWTSILGVISFVLAGIFAGLTENDQLIMFCFLLAVICIIVATILTVKQGGTEVTDQQSKPSKSFMIIRSIGIAVVLLVVLLASLYGINMEKYAPYGLIAGLVLFLITVVSKVKN